MNDVYFFTDLHGQLRLYQIIKTFICQDNTDIGVFGGDACDRGPDGYKIMKDMLSSPQIIYLKGNHEDMFVKSAIALYKHFKGKFPDWTRDKYQYEIEELAFSNNDIYISYKNNGVCTLVDWIEDGASMDFVNKINHLRLITSYKEYDFSHTAVMPKTYKQANINELDEHAEFMFLWDREHLAWGWYKNRINVFGHTPTTHLSRKIQKGPYDVNNIKPYAWTGLVDTKTYPGIRLDMDTGAIWTNRAFVLSCNTNLIIGFQDTKDDMIVLDPYDFRQELNS